MHSSTVRTVVSTPVSLVRNAKRMMTNVHIPQNIQTKAEAVALRDASLAEVDRVLAAAKRSYKGAIEVVNKARHGSVSISELAGGKVSHGERSHAEDRDIVSFYAPVHYKVHKGGNLDSALDQLFARHRNRVVEYWAEVFKKIPA